MIKAVATQQLTLMPTSTTNPRFALSRSTRERGLRHVAQIRELMAERHDKAA